MKKIYGFKLLINDEPICRAGFEEENAVLSCIISSVRRKNEDAEVLDLFISGMISETEQYASWDSKSLKEGDKISIEIISGDFDLPTSISPKKSEKDIIADKLRHYNKLKEELKEYLEE